MMMMAVNSVRWCGDRMMMMEMMAANSVRWGGDRMMMMMMAANSVRWGGDREDDDGDDGGEQCELGWR